MPLYDYRCRACSKVTEVRHGFREAHAETCPECGGELARVFTPAGIVFKGSGFYLTDSRKASETAKASASKKASDAAKPAETAPTTDATPASPTTPAAAPAAAAAPPSAATSAPKNSESSAA
ncbi:MAG TPA: FmdB family zinc ribbon protein [Candidatus Elarobacter sp.]